MVLKSYRRWTFPSEALRKTINTGTFSARWPKSIASTSIGVGTTDAINISTETVKFPSYRRLKHQLGFIDCCYWTDYPDYSEVIWYDPENAWKVFSTLGGSTDAISGERNKTYGVQGSQTLSWQGPVSGNSTQGANDEGTWINYPSDQQGSTSQ